MSIKELGSAVKVGKETIEILDRDRLSQLMDEIIYEAVFSEGEKKKGLFLLIKEVAKTCGAVPASIQGLYEDMGKNYPGFTVPAINIRGLTYDSARAVFRKAKDLSVGAFIFEIARSEIGYTNQRPLEYAAVVLAAAVREGFIGPVFIQGDHFQLVRKHFLSDPTAETGYMKGLISEAVEAEFYNIDIDASTLVDLEKPHLTEQQRPNFEKTAELATLIRSIQPEGIDISIGGEIGEIGKKNSTPEELKAYLKGFNNTFSSGKGLSKLSVQSGTSHGGVVLPDGTLAQVSIDFETLRQLSDIARREFGLSGAVQHGASTLPDDAFHMFPETGTSEVHLATGFQNIIYDSSHLPESFRADIYDFIKKEFSGEQKAGQTEEQFMYKTRKKGFGPRKKAWWDLDKTIRDAIMTELEQKFALLFEKLRVDNTTEIVQKTVHPVPVRKALPADILGSMNLS